MAITRKGQKKPEKVVPAELTALVDTAATYSVAAAFFKDRYEAARGQVCAYLDAKDCPVETAVGAGGGVKLPGLGSLSFTQPERVDNGEAIDVVIAALKDGSLLPDALAEVISTVSREGLEKCLPEQAKALVKTSDKVVTTLRVANEYKTEVALALAEAVDAVEAKKALPAGTVEIPLAQPTASFTAAVADAIDDGKVTVPA